MADIADPESPVAAKRGRGTVRLALGLAGALVLGGGGFLAVYSGLVLGGHATAVDGPHGKEDPAGPLPPIAFVPVDPLIVNLGSAGRHLRFRAELEVVPAHRDEVEALMPRIVDVLNGYLRAVSLEDLEAPAALIRLRAQMLRRIQTVTGEGRVRDLLVMEFVLN